MVVPYLVATADKATVPESICNSIVYEVSAAFYNTPTVHAGRAPKLKSQQGRAYTPDTRLSASVANSERRAKANEFYDANNLRLEALHAARQAQLEADPDAPLVQLEGPILPDPPVLAARPTKRVGAGEVWLEAPIEA